MYICPMFYVAPLSISSWPQLQISLSNEQLVNSKQLYNLMPAQNIQNAAITLTKDSNQRVIHIIIFITPKPKICIRKYVFE